MCEVEMFILKCNAARSELRRVAGTKLWEAKRRMESADHSDRAMCHKREDLEKAMEYILVAITMFEESFLPDSKILERPPSITQ